MPGPIGFLVRAIRNAAKPKGKKPPQASSSGNQENAETVSKSSDLEATSPPPTPEEESIAKSKAQSYIALSIIGFGLAIDYTMALMSIQPLYYIVGGHDNLYGLVYGSYDLAGMLLVPVFAYLTIHVLKSFKRPLALGGIVNALGNLLYAFTMLIGNWWPMLVGRFIAGAGASTLAIGSGYISRTTKLEERQDKLGAYRIYQNIARVIGPFVGYFFLGLPEVDSTSSTALKLFNWYTMPGWLAFVVVLFMTAIFLWFFVEPTKENKHLLEEQLVPQEDAMTEEQIRRLSNFQKLRYWWLPLSFSSLFSSTAQMSNLFALFAATFKGVANQQDNWKTYIGVGVGAIVGGMSFRIGIRKFPKIFDERYIILVTNWLLFTSWMLTIPWNGLTYVPSEALYYIATGLLAAANVVNATSLETFFSKKLTQFETIIGSEKIVENLSLYFMFSTGGKFAGALVVGLVTRIATISGQTGVCLPEPSYDDTGNEVCEDAANSCIITGDTYYTAACVLYNSNYFYPIMAGITAFVNVLFHWVIYRWWSYSE